MKAEQLFPSALILLNICAAVVYGCRGDVRMVIDWIAAAVLNGAVTF